MHSLGNQFRTKLWRQCFSLLCFHFCFWTPVHSFGFSIQVTTLVTNWVLTFLMLLMLQNHISVIQILSCDQGKINVAVKDQKSYFKYTSASPCHTATGSPQDRRWVSFFPCGCMYKTEVKETTLDQIRKWAEETHSWLFPGVFLPRLTLWCNLEPSGDLCFRGNLLYILATSNLVKKMQSGLPQYPLFSVSQRWLFLLLTNRNMLI